MKSKATGILAGAAALLASFGAQGATYSLTKDDAQGKTSFANVSGSLGSGWKSGSSTQSYPSEGNDYLVKNCALRTPATTSAYTFKGDSLTLQTDLTAGTLKWGSLNCKHKGGTGAPVTINKLVLQNGRCSISDSFNSSSNKSKTIAGNIYVEEGYFGYFGTSGSETDERRMDLPAAFHGAGSVVFDLCSSKTIITVSGDNADFSGRLYVDHDGRFNTANGGGQVVFSKKSSWPSDCVASNAEGVVVNNGGQIKFAFADALSIGETRGFRINNKAATLDVATDCAVTINGPVASDKGFRKSNYGTLVLTGDNAGLTEDAVISVTAGTLKLKGASADERPFPAPAF